MQTKLDRSANAVELGLGRSRRRRRNIAQHRLVVIQDAAELRRQYRPGVHQGLHGPLVLVERFGVRLRIGVRRDR